MNPLAGGGIDLPQQIIITPPPAPPADEVNVLAWVAGVVVPLLIAVGGWLFTKRLSSGSVYKDDS